MGNGKPLAEGDAGAIDDLVFGLLSSPTRRTVLRHLAHCPLPVTVDELVAVVVASEAEESVHQIDEKRRAAIRLTLAHVHLPKLVESGLVENTPDGDSVVLSPLGRNLAGLRPRAWNAFDITFDGAQQPGSREETSRADRR